MYPVYEALVFCAIIILSIVMLFALAHSKVGLRFRRWCNRKNGFFDLGDIGIDREVIPLLALTGAVGWSAGHLFVFVLHVIKG